ncbi:hypothetical protein [Pseudonocardia sp.]|jgi:hypothetical protein|uniref:hypothetical protein n=1 Tax=Pseudonocardia sp. TaxID=60912 RepID=UPI0031FD0C74
MTTYAYDRTASSIVAVWETGAGAVAKRVARVPSRATEPVVLRLAEAMTGLSSILWHAYTDPHLVGPPSARLALRGLRHPDLPLDGVLMRRGDPLVDSAHEVGRAVGELGSGGLARSVAQEVEAECAAVERAVRGDLSGRGRQAVLLTRLDASPAQIAVADGFLRDVPMGSEELFTQVDGMAAATAAIPWLHAAADVTAALSGLDPVGVLEEAERTQGGDVTTAVHVLEMVEEMSPVAVARELAGPAVLAGRGMLLVDAHSHDEPRFTLVDPVRPARSLLESVIKGIQACFVVYSEHLAPDRFPDTGEGRWIDIARESFDEAVRAERAATR